MLYVRAYVVSHSTNQFHGSNSENDNNGPCETNLQLPCITVYCNNIKDHN